ANNGTTDDTQPTFSGTGTPGNVVKIYDGSTVIGSATVGTDGKYSVTPAAPLAEGAHNITATQTNPVGTESAKSPATAFTVDTTPPAKPATSAATDDVGTIVGPIAAGSTTDDTQPTFSGTGTAGDVIKVYDGSTVIGSATVGADGKYSITPSTPLTSGAHSITTSATDPSGNESAKSDPLAFTVSNAPVNTVPGAQTASEDTQLALTGLSVTDVDGDLASTQLSVAHGTLNIDLTGGATVSAGANNSATLTLVGTQAQINAALATVKYTGVLNYNGADTLTVVSTDKAGKLDSDTVAINVTPVNDAPIVANPIADTAGSVGTALSYTVASNAFTDVDNASLTYTATQADGTALPSWLSFDATTRVFSGTPPSTAAGKLSVKVTASDGSLSANDSFDITISSVASFSSMTKDTSRVGANADWTTADGSAGRLVSGTLNGALASGEKLAVYSNGVLLGNATVSGQSWTITDLSDYSAASAWTYTAKVIGSNYVGQTSTQQVNTDYVADAPVITGVTDAASASVANNGTTTKALSSVSGTAEVGSTVHLYDNSYKNLVGVAVVDAAGKWTVSNLANVGAGSNAFVAVEVDNNGAVSKMSNLWTATTTGGTNLLTNGDFSGGATGFTTSGIQSGSGSSSFFNQTYSTWAVGPNNAWVNGSNVPYSTVATNQTASGTFANGTWSKKFVTPSGTTDNAANPNGAIQGNSLYGSLLTGSENSLWNSSVSVVAGRTYQFSFDYVDHYLGSGMIVTIDGTRLQVVSSPSINSAESGNYTLTYVASTTKTIALGISSAHSLTSGGDWVLDNMNFVDAAPANDGTLVAGAAMQNAGSGNDSLSFVQGTPDGRQGDDTITVSSAAALQTLSSGGRIIGGAGVDTLKLAAGSTLDLTTLTTNQTVHPIQEVEVLQMQGTSSIKLSANDVLSLGGANTGTTVGSSTTANTMAPYSFASTAGGAASTSSQGKVQMVINGTSTDQLTLSGLMTDGVTTNGIVGNTGLSGTWTYQGTTSITVNGVATTFRVYDHSTSNAQVLTTVTAANTVIAPVNAPFNTVPAAQTVNESTPLSIAGISVNDADGDLTSTKLSVNNGTLNIDLTGGATISGGANNTATLTLSGTQTQINAALATVKYTGVANYTGADTLTVLSTDKTGTQDSDTVAITVKAIVVSGTIAATVDSTTAQVENFENATLAGQTFSTFAGDAVDVTYQTTNGVPVKSVYTTAPSSSQLNSGRVLVFGENAQGAAREIVFQSKFGSFSSVSFRYEDLQKDGTSSNPAVVAGTVYFYDSNGVQVASQPIYENASKKVQTFSWSGATVKASSFKMVVSGDSWLLDNLNFVPASGDLPAVGTTIDTTPLLHGTISTALTGAQQLVVFDGSTQLGIATVTGTDWTYQVSGAALGQHNYVAKVMEGSSVITYTPTQTLTVVATPLVLDLNGDGVQTTDLAHGAVFDIDNNGTPEHVGWVDKRDGLLVLDRNGDGVINHGGELFGNNTVLANGSKAANGWAALADLDSNADGVVDAKDARFAELRVWVDSNGDGVSNQGELHSLAEEGIASIALAHTEEVTSQNGNQLYGTGTVTHTDGAVTQITDALLQAQALPVLNLDAVIKAGVADLTNGQAEVVKLNVSDVLQLPEDGAGMHQLKIVGDSNDVVDLNKLFADGHATGHWAQSGAVTQDGHAFNVYQYSGDQSLQVLIDSHIANANVHSS
ncbi:MAG: Ig-like domain-containing protein, partial [Limnohabitans sp.]